MTASELFRETLDVRNHSNCASFCLEIVIFRCKLQRKKFLKIGQSNVKVNFKELYNLRVSFMKYLAVTIVGIKLSPNCVSINILETKEKRALREDNVGDYRLRVGNSDGGGEETVL